MGYFLMMTWPWWLLTIAIAVLVIFLISRFWAAWNWPTADSADSADSAGRAGGESGELAAARARIAELEAQLAEARRGEPLSAVDS